MKKGYSSNRSSYWKWLMHLLLIIISASTLSIIIIVGLYRWVNPPITWLMVERYFSTEKTKFTPYQQQWVSVNKVSPYILQAVVAAEDNLFMSHRGFDFQAIRDAHQDRLQRKRIRGASTISMQVSKNVFLWHGRTWTRKGLEAAFTAIIETLWGKKRIMEVYLNIAEFGPSIYGVEAASQHYFKKNAAELSRHEAALLATTLPNPLYRNPSSPSNYMINYQQRILRNMRNIGEIDLNKK